MTKFLNISTDTTLGGNSPSDETVSSQKALKTYIDAHSSGSPSWGSITGTLSNQTDLQTALNAKADDNAVVKLSGNQTVAGTKTFTSSPVSQRSTASGDNPYGDFYVCKDTGINYKTNPSINKTYYPVAVKDTNNQFMGWLSFGQNTDGSVYHGIKARTRNTADTANIDGEISVRVYRDGGVNTYAPTPVQDNTTSNQIDTVGARNTKLDTLLSTLYPVGSIYITTANTCPLSTLISGSTWELVGSGKVLQGADANHAVNTTINAGLPDITGSIGIGGGGANNAYARYDRSSATGAFSMTQQSGTDYPFSNAGTKQGVVDKFDFKASDSNSIYGGSTTVQPPAYCVNIYRRTA